MHLTSDELAHRFTFHQPKTPDKVRRHETVRSICLEAAEQLLDVMGPDSRERSVAVTKLEEVMFWANAAIAREIEAAA